MCHALCGVHPTTTAKQVLKLTPTPVVVVPSLAVVVVDVFIYFYFFVCALYWFWFLLICNIRLLSFTFNRTIEGWLYITYIFIFFSSFHLIVSYVLLFLSLFFFFLIENFVVINLKKIKGTTSSFALFFQIQFPSRIEVFLFLLLQLIANKAGESINHWKSFKNRLV